jgi:hypothetical protein
MEWIIVKWGFLIGRGKRGTDLEIVAENSEDIVE